MLLYIQASFLLPSPHELIFFTKYPPAGFSVNLCSSGWHIFFSHLGVPFTVSHSLLFSPPASTLHFFPFLEYVFHKKPSSWLRPQMCPAVCQFELAGTCRTEPTPIAPAVDIWAPEPRGKTEIMVSRSKCCNLVLPAVQVKRPENESVTFSLSMGHFWRAAISASGFYFISSTAIHFYFQILLIMF